MRSDVSLHGTVGVEGDAGAPGTGVDGTEDAQAAEHDVQQITAAFAQFLEHMLLLASSAHVAAEFPVFVFSCWSSSVQEDDMRLHWVCTELWGRSGVQVGHAWASEWAGGSGGKAQDTLTDFLTIWTALSLLLLENG